MPQKKYARLPAPFAGTQAAASFPASRIARVCFKTRRFVVRAAVRPHQIEASLPLDFANEEIE
jgi:hypothetical protein